MANVHFACNKTIWGSKAPPRCKFFMWLVVHRKFLTSDNLLRRGYPASISCPLYFSEPEDCTHLFIHHRFTQQVWRFLKFWTGADFVVPDDQHGCIEGWWLQARAGIPKPMRGNFHTIAILMHWRLWKEKNSRVFDHMANNADRVFDLVREDIAVWRSAGCITDLGS